MQILLKDDIKNLFLRYEENRNIESIYQIWELLSFARKNNLFDKNYYIYCLIKTLYLPNNDGLFVLYVNSIIDEVCNLDNKEFGIFIKDRIDFMIATNNIEKTIIIVNSALSKGAVFESFWIKDLVEKLNLNFSLVELNTKNEYNYFNKTLK